MTGGIAALTFAIVKVNDWGWGSPGIGVSFAAAIVLLAAVRLALPALAQPVRRSRAVPHSAVHRRRAGNGALFGRLRRHAAFHRLVGADGVGMVGAEDRAGDRARAAAGPDHVAAVRGPADRALRRGGRSSPQASSLSPAGLIWWAIVIGLEPNAALVVIGMVPDRHRRRPDLSDPDGRQRSALPSSSFATGSGVINMIRQASLAVGVAIFVAIIGSPASQAERVAAFHRGWWIMAGVVVLGLIPTFFLIRSDRK